MVDEASALPKELRRFNWAAFFAPHLWGLAHGVSLGLWVGALGPVGLAAGWAAALFFAIAGYGEPGGISGFDDTARYSLQVLTFYGCTFAPLVANRWFARRADRLLEEAACVAPAHAPGSSQERARIVVPILFGLYWGTLLLWLGLYFALWVLRVTRPL